jgi:hypothetical protein
VASCKVVCCVFFAADELFRVEQLAVSPGPDLDDGRFKVQEHSAWDVFSGPSLTEKRVEGVVSATNCFVAWHLSIRLKKIQIKIILEQPEISTPTAQIRKQKGLLGG